MDDHVVAEQRDVLEFLSDPLTYRIVETVKRIDTHGAVVFLAGRDAYKVKRAVRFPFMDFSTLGKRKLACDRELAVNRDNAPDIYLGVVPITRSKDGLSFGGEGEIVEWAVHMRRFDENSTLDRLATRDRLSPSLISDLAHAVVRSHERAPRQDFDAAGALDRYILENADSFAESPDLFSSDRVRALTLSSRTLLSDNKPLLVARRKAGHVRRCHGDLHLRNIVLIGGKPVLFDALEFDEGMATGDVLYDLAFLVMDLWERDFRQAANAILNHYLWESGDEAHLVGLAALPLFLSVRAAIRAKVTAASLPHLAEQKRTEAAREAKRYFRLAEDFLVPAPARLVAVGGLSGTGKTTIAAELAPHLGRIPGAVHLRTDIERKQMFRAAETQHLPQSGYSPSATAEVYARLQRKAKLALASGFGVIADGVHAEPGERAGIEGAAREVAAPFNGLWLEAPLALRIERVEGRRGDASDANADYVRKQATVGVGPLAWRRIEASGTPARIVADALAVLGVSRAPTDPASSSRFGGLVMEARSIAAGGAA
ncbi:MAG: AAA family ATPase [Hyphomicrobiales bacterium]